MGEFTPRKVFRGAGVGVTGRYLENATMPKPSTLSFDALLLLMHAAE